MTPVGVGLTSALTAVIVAAIGYLGIRYTARSSRAASDKTSRATEWNALVDQYKDLPRQMGEAQREIADLRRDKEADRGRIEHLEDGQREARRLYEVGVDYIKQLLVWIANQDLPHKPPPAPVDITTDLGMRPVDGGVSDQRASPNAPPDHQASRRS